VVKLKVDNTKALGYRMGMTGPGGDGEGQERQQQQQQHVRVAQKRACKHCGSENHVRITSKHCRATPKYKEWLQDKAIGMCGTYSTDMKIGCTFYVTSQCSHVISYCNVHIVFYRGGITPGGTVDDVAAEATEEVMEDSEIDENIDNIEWKSKTLTV
jgi:hypothetical protein